MKDVYIPKLSLNKPTQLFQDGITGHVQKANPFKQVQGPDFKSVMANTLGGVNNVLSAPDALMHEAMTTGRVDVHDVMVANAKAELAVNITAQVATKVVQAYDRILQIQI